MSEYTYSAFISYKHDPDVTLAAAIQERNKKNRGVCYTERFLEGDSCPADRDE